MTAETDHPVDTIASVPADAKGWAAFSVSSIGSVSEAPKLVVVPQPPLVVPKTEEQKAQEALEEKIKAEKLAEKMSKAAREASKIPAKKFLRYIKNGMF